MTQMLMAERLEHFKQAYPTNQASWPWLVREQKRAVLYGVWVIGNDYRNKSGFYGSYPPSYLARVAALFPDVNPMNHAEGRLTTLHVFSGSLPAGDYVRCDINQDVELRCNVYDLEPETAGTFDLLLADPPYSAADGAHYGTGGVDRRRAMAALARVTRVGGHLAWLDTCWPMHSKKDWLTVGRILVQRSTNHRSRVLSIFERAAA